MADHIQKTIENGVLRLRIAREEKKNALTEPMYAALADAFHDAASNADIRAVLLEGGDDIFTAGNDLSTFASRPSLTGDEKPPVWRFIENVSNCPKPVVAAISGAAIGIGATILLHCDLVYADESAYLHMPFTDLATVPEAGASYLLPLRFGRQIAAEFVLVGDKISARRAYEMGVVNAVIEGDVRAHAVSIAERLAAKPPNAMQKTKALMHSDKEQLFAHIPVEMQEFGRCLQSEEMQAVIMKMMMKK